MSLVRSLSADSMLLLYSMYSFYFLFLDRVKAILVHRAHRLLSESTLILCTLRSNSCFHRHEVSEKSRLLVKTREGEDFKRKSNRAQAISRMAKSKRREKKRRRKSNIGLKKWRQAVSTTIQKSATSSAKRGRNSASIRRRPQRSSD